MSSYLVQGFFFQKDSWLSPGYDPDEHDFVVMINSAMCRFMFSGIIHKGHKKAYGAMVDQFGKSQLSDITIAPAEFGFTKKYDHRRDIITYIFKKLDSNENGIWVGKYTGKATGDGRANCILTEIPKIMLHEPEAENPQKEEDKD